MSDTPPNRCRKGHTLAALTSRQYRGRTICKRCDAERAVAYYARRISRVLRCEPVAENA